ncbi:DUF2059 domain-containing protein [Mucilaginibacter sp. cycad4]|uniref:DUF2059 domain-containing protein n=1 Tax=Mucilaginibacter sp. cycad4 TaxID=3342096 RepID=UPI002AAAC68E|nr:DUF2059 domain-containing protein [Mucilaginibacter gossypii]WPU98520.1 DUF2059 domain-containing protein [Mucilaginibacter gossypii]
MNLKLKLIALAGVILFSFSTLRAQTSNQAFTASHLKTAEQFLLATGTKEQFDATMNSIIKQGAKNVDSNQRDAYLKVMREFVGKYLTWDVLKEKLAEVYATEFTEAELNELNIFYNSPVGKKLVTRTPELLSRISATSQGIVAEHKTELEQNIAEAYKHTDPPAVKELVIPAASQPTSKTATKH